jgi:hypothetical protein
MVVIAISQSRATLQKMDPQQIQLTLVKPLAAGLVDKTIEDACALWQRGRVPAPRYTTSLRVSATLLEKGKERPLRNVILKNLSSTGACLQSGQILPMGVLVSVHFDLPEMSLPFKATANVMWSDSLGQCGIQFVDAHPEQRRALRDWLKSKPGRTSAQPAIRHALPANKPGATWRI